MASEGCSKSSEINSTPELFLRRAPYSGVTVGVPISFSAWGGGGELCTLCSGGGRVLGGGGGFWREGVGWGGGGGVLVLVLCPL